MPKAGRSVASHFPSSATERVTIAQGRLGITLSTQNPSPNLVKSASRAHCTKNRHFRAIAYPSLRAENACAKES